MEEYHKKLDNLLHDLELAVMKHKEYVNPHCVMTVLITYAVEIALTSAPSESEAFRELRKVLELNIYEHGKSMENLRKIYGKSMENLRKIYGKSKE